MSVDKILRLEVCGAVRTLVLSFHLRRDFERISKFIFTQHCFIGLMKPFMHTLPSYSLLILHPGN